MRLHGVTAGLVCASLAIAGCGGARLRTAPFTLSVVGTNDLHGALLERDGRGGLALFAGYVNNLRAARAADDGATMLVDAGDMWQGTLESNLSEGAAVVAAYNVIGYAAAAIGNHEFDYGPVGERPTPGQPSDDPRGALKARAAEARFPFLAANIVETEEGRPVDWPNVAPSTTIDIDGALVGVIGVTTTATIEATHAANTRGLSIAPLASSIAAEARRLRDAGAAVVIVASHAGGRCEAWASSADVSSCDPRSEIIQVARALEAGLVDVIVAGHTHAVIAHEINGIAVIESYSRGRAFGRVDLRVDPLARRVTSRVVHPPRDVCAFADAEFRCLPEGRAPPADRAGYEGRAVVRDARVSAVLEPFVRQAAAVKTRPLGVEVDEPLAARVRGESALGNLIADGLHALAPDADIAINNSDGGLRADLPAGPLTYGRLYEVFPFDNVAVRFTTSGAELERALAGRLSSSRDVLGISGMRVESGCTAAGLDVRLTRANGRRVADDEPLDVLTTDYLATTSLFAAVAAARRATPVGARPLREGIADWLTARGGRLAARAFADDAVPRYPLRDTLPMRCTSR